jgi:hypothetical protein
MSLGVVPCKITLAPVNQPVKLGSLLAEELGVVGYGPLSYFLRWLSYGAKTL